MKTKFVYAVRYPIAIHARLYSPSNDVAHTIMGEKCAKTKGKNYLSMDAGQ
jgi:hypothetical protein